MGAWAVVAKLQPQYVGASSLDNRMRKTKEKGGAYNYYYFVDKRRVLTLPEEKELAKFVADQAERDDGQKRRDISKKIVEILHLRQANNRGGGRQYAAMSRSAQKALV
jgi:hypothetical protein